MLAWAKRMTWKGLQPLVDAQPQSLSKGVSLSKAAMRAVEARLERDPLLPKWDILIPPGRSRLNRDIHFEKSYSPFAVQKVQKLNFWGGELWGA